LIKEKQGCPSRRSITYGRLERRYLVSDLKNAE